MQSCARVDQWALQASACALHPHVLCVACVQLHVTRWQIRHVLLNLAASVHAAVPHAAPSHCRSNVAPSADPAPSNPLLYSHSNRDDACRFKTSSLTSAAGFNPTSSPLSPKTALLTPSHTWPTRRTCLCSLRWHLRSTPVPQPCPASCCFYRELPLIAPLHQHQHHPLPSNPIDAGPLHLMRPGRVTAQP